MTMAAAIPRRRMMMTLVRPWLAHGPWPVRYPQGIPPSSPFEAGVSSEGVAVVQLAGEFCTSF